MSSPSQSTQDGRTAAADATSTEISARAPLDGILVVEMGQLIAGPFATQMLAYFGADVIKIEPPGRGDPLRTWRMLDEAGTSYWWRSVARNKQSVTLDLSSDAGQSIARGLLSQADVLVENFRPGRMEAWGLGPESMRESNPDLIYTRVSGYGQSGPYASQPGFASACEGVAGFRYVNGFPGDTPVRPNLSMGDTLAGMHAVIGTLLALFTRVQHKTPGQVVDVSIVESVFNLMEGVWPEYSGTGEVRQPSGSTLTGIVPTNTYRCRDDRYVVIGGNGDSIFKRLMAAAGHPELADDPRFVDNASRVKHESDIDAVLSEWTSSVDSTELLQTLADASVPAGPINSIADIAEDPHFQARGIFESVQVGQDTRSVPALPPLLEKTPGRTRHAGPDLGVDTDRVLRERLGFDESRLATLRSEGVI